MSDPYAIDITEEAEEDLKGLDKRQAKLAIKKIYWIAENAQELQHTRLKGKKWEGLSRHTSGHDRIIYKVDHNEKLIIIVAVGHRRNVYDD